jgi:DNA-binding transcriptional LysR family regulator
MRRLDLNALAVLDAMLKHKSVTNAGAALGLSQPAMSAALAKLRAQFDDPLFVRTGRGMRPTPRALALADPVDRILRTVHEEILHPAAFDAATSERTFTIITPDIGEVAFLPRLHAHVERHAPGVTLHTVAMQPAATEEALEAGAADLALGYFPDLARRGFFQQRLFRNSFACMVRAGHPLAGRRLALDDFLAASHALVRPAGRTHLFETFVEKRGLKLDVRVRLSHFSSLLTLIAESDLIATVPLDIARTFARLADVRLMEPPVKPPAFDLKQHWHRRFHHDPANAWLRATVRELFHD